MSKKRAAPAASSNGTTQERPRYLPQNQPDLPNIPGVPPDLTPLLVTALRSCTKFFGASDTPQTPFSKQNNGNNTQSASVVESILNRMVSNDETKKLKAKKEQMNQDIESWVSAVKRRAKECFKGSSNTVPLSCFRYLWDLQQEHSRVAVKRASLHMCGLLLQKSSECRFFVSTDEVLLTFVTSVVSAKNIKANSSEKQVSCWQQEVLEWMTFLSDSFGDLYPKFCVGQRFLQQRAPSLNSDDNNTLTEGNMADLRKLRDVAMRYGNQEMNKVDKLIQRAHKCLDVLVPRMGVSVGNDDSKPSAVPKESAKATHNDNNNVDDEDDDIDWEDGDEEFDEGASDAQAHAEAVERTLAAMAASAGGLQGGNIEINLESKDEESPNDVMDENTRKLLQKTVQSVETRHMKRLSSWVDALTRADGLVLNEKSLVVMSAEIAQQRRHLLQKLLDRKQTLASILASAARIGITVDSTNSSAESAETPRAAAATHVPPPRQRAVLATAARRRYDTKVARKRSTKLQIKYRSS